LAVAPPIFSLEGKTAIVTGASSGIGARMAQVLAAAGARTAIVARRSDRLDDIATRCPGTVPIVADLADRSQVQQAADRALASLGGIDILVNNAGTLIGGVRAEDETLDQIRLTLSVNLEAAILLAQSVFPGMKARGAGSIINVTSTSAVVGTGRYPLGIYSASKGGLEAISREWAAQWSRHGVRVNCISPGFTETEISSRTLASPSVAEWVKRNALLPRHGQPEDFDGALLFLASDASRYVTGQSLGVDGGWTAH
jgi:NAD(P)-dependent dehydrogenase (short-subunit alcohol dehydrogenase family)